MPLEIRELLIKATVDDKGGDKGAKPTGGDNQQGADSLINLCVEKVLEILKEKEER